MIRLAMLSFWHVHAEDYVKQVQAHPVTEVVAAWDETPERGRTQAQILGVPFYEKLADLLAQAEIDGVIITAPTSLHHQVMIAAAQAGKHIFTEKVIAPTLREVDEILAVVEQAGVQFIVSLPRLYHGSTQAIQNILTQQFLGNVTQVRIRLSHNGALTAYPKTFLRRLHAGAKNGFSDELFVQMIREIDFFTWTTRFHQRPNESRRTV